MGKRDRKGLAPGIKVARRSSASSEVAGGARAAAAATVFTGGSEQSDHCETALRGIEVSGQEFQFHDGADGGGATD